MSPCLTGEARRILRISRATLDKWILQGKLHPYQEAPGRPRVLDRAEVDSVAARMRPERVNGKPLIPKEGPTVVEGV